MDASRFTPEGILADNLNALLKTRDGPNSEIGLAKKSGVGQATIGRIRKRQGAAKIDTVSKLAKAYGLEGWQLMVAGMNPTNPPVLQPLSRAERELHARLNAAFAELAKLKEGGG